MGLTNSSKLVLFRYDKSLKEVVAVFPFTNGDKNLCTVVGQKGRTYEDDIYKVIENTVNADIDQYFLFFKKLEEKMGSMKVITLNDEGTITYSKAPSGSDISFGYGAQQYIDVFFTEVIDEEGKVKDYFTRNGLRYRR
ncbi:MAG: hypothetical protein IK102_04290 [Treponema sp.]|nr:hypothetical protein [Treponema sp.]